MEKEKHCLYCDEVMEGRKDKIFCNPNCKSAYHYTKSQEKEASLYNQIDNQLKLNRRLLKLFNKAGKATIRKEELVSEGFNPKFFTHYWKNKKGDLYLFCYEFGFLERKENGKSKFVLVHWQHYMGN
mgnify:CR=1 FL=1